MLNKIIYTVVAVILCFTSDSFARSTELDKVSAALGAAEIQRSGVDGKGVHVLVMDSYGNAVGDERSHGDLVIEFLKKMAPGAAATHVEFKNSDLLHTDLTQSHRDDIVDIINISSVWRKKSLWRKDFDTIRLFAENGALIVIAAGNSAQVFGESLDQKEIAQLAFEINTNPDIPGAILFAGQAPLPGAKRSLPISIFSERAGIVAPYYLVAPNQGFLVEDRQGNLEPIQGTSFAAPTLVGLAALLKSSFPGLTGKSLAHLLLLSASPIEISPEEKETILGIFAFALDKSNQDVMNILVPEHERMQDDEVNKLIGFYFSGQGIPNLQVAFALADNMPQSTTLPATKNEALATALRFEQYNVLVPEGLKKLQETFNKRVESFLTSIQKFQKKQSDTMRTIMSLREKQMLNIAAIYGKSIYSHYKTAEGNIDAVEELYRVAKIFLLEPLLKCITCESRRKLMSYSGPISKKLLKTTGYYMDKKITDWKDLNYDANLRETELEFIQEVIGYLFDAKAIYGQAVYSLYKSSEGKKEATEDLYRIAKVLSELSRLKSVSVDFKQKVKNYLEIIFKKTAEAIGDYIAHKTYDWRDPMYDVGVRNSELQFSQDIIGYLLKSSYVTAEEKTLLLTYLDRFRLTQISRP